MAITYQQDRTSFTRIEIIVEKFHYLQKGFTSSCVQVEEFQELS